MPEYANIVGHIRTRETPLCFEELHDLLFEHEHSLKSQEAAKNNQLPLQILLDREIIVDIKFSVVNLMAAVVVMADTPMVDRINQVHILGHPKFPPKAQHMLLEDSRHTLIH